jgi:hypothetical protein
VEKDKTEWTERDQGVLQDLIRCTMPDKNGQRAMNRLQLARLKEQYPETHRRLLAATGIKE